jgi:hypothetical protein
VQVYAWIMQLLTTLLQLSPLPPVVQGWILKGVQLAFTPACVSHLEAEAKVFVWSQLQAVIKANPSSLITTEVLTEIAKVLSGPAGVTP